MIFFDLAILDLLLLFVELRQPIILVFLSVINQSLELTQTKTTNLYNHAMYEVSFDCRKIYFQHYLNDRHDNDLRRIYIRDRQSINPIFLYNKAEENEPFYLHNKIEDKPPVYFYNQSEQLSLIDFEVVVPIGFSYNSNLLNSHIRKFKLPGLKYLIVEE